MASGFGLNGGRGRCFAFWQEFQKCYAVADSPQECLPQKEDYMECLHHGKEIARAQQIKEHYIHKQAHKAQEQREQGELRATGGILRLGLITDDQGDGGKGGDSPKSSSSE